MYLLIDCNNFFVSCERLFAPEYRRKPVVVLSNNDGCAISRSNEVKNLGIKMGQPLFEFEHLVKKHNVKTYSTNFKLYRDVSRKIMNILSKYSQYLEVYSIDEAFLYFDEDDKDFYKIAKKIKREILVSLDIPVSIGIAPTKTLAKIASEWNKRSTGICEINGINRVEILSKFPVEDVWGVGRAYSKKLIKRNFRTAQEFAQANISIFSRVNVNLRITHMELNGIECIKFQHPKVPKSMAHTRTLYKGVSDLTKLNKIVSEFAELLSFNLTNKFLYTSHMLVFIDVPSDEPGASFRRRQHFADEVSFMPTCYAPDLIKIAKILLKKIHISKHKVKKIGIIYSSITPINSTKLELFGRDLTERNIKIMNNVVKYNNKVSRNVIHTGATEQDKHYVANRKVLSQKYTSSWEELLKVK